MYAFVATVLVIVGVAYIVRVAAGFRKLKSQSFASLMEDMCYVDFTQVCLVGRSSLVKDYPDQSAAQMFTLQLGGVEGLHRLYVNAGIMLDVVRYLAITNSEAQELARQIRQDAAKVRRMALVLLLRHYVGVWRLSSPLTVPKLARLYVALTLTMDEMYIRVADDLLAMLQEVSSGNSRLRRVAGAIATTVTA